MPLLAWFDIRQIIPRTSFLILIVENSNSEAPDKQFPIHAGPTCFTPWLYFMKIFSACSSKVLKIIRLTT